MGRGSRGNGHQSAPGPVDLTGTISVAERNELINLVNAITEEMHRDISNVFTSRPVSPTLGPDGQGQWLTLPLLRQESENKENISTGNNCRGIISDVCSTTHSKSHQIIGREGNGKTQQLGELKKEVLSFYKKWQVNVLQRFKEARVNDPTVRASGSRGRGRNVRGGSRASRGGYGGGGGPCASILETDSSRFPKQPADPDMAARYPPLANHLWALKEDRRKLLLQIVLLAVLSLQNYNAYSRQLIVKLASSLNLSFRLYQAEEDELAEKLARVAASDASQEDDINKTNVVKGSRKFRTVFCNGAGPSGSGVGARQGRSGLTPFTAAGLLGNMAEDVKILGSLFGMKTDRPLGKMLEALASAKDFSDFAFIRLCDGVHYDYTNAREPPADHRRLRVLVTISGFLANSEDFVKPWRFLKSQPEIYAIRWEDTALKNVGGALKTVIRSEAWQSAKGKIESNSIFKTLMTSAWPKPLLRVSKIVDNHWSVGMVKADKMGAILADALLKHKFQGERPVSLIGYSLGARAIYTCLMILAERRQFGLIDSVVLIGAPFPAESRVWLTMKSVVSGRLVNVYSESDYMLGFLYRTCNLQFGIAGLQEIQGADSVENHCMRALPQGHLSYSSLIGHILKDIGWEDFDMHVFHMENPPRPTLQNPPYPSRKAKYRR